MIRTRRHIARFGGPYDAKIKFSFPCNERSGLTLTDIIHGIQVSPGQSGYAGSLSFTDPYGVTVENELGGTFTPLLTGAWPSLDTSKVLLMTAVVKCVDATKSRVAIGNFGYGSGFSLSMSSGMHTSIMSDSGGAVQSSLETAKTIINGTVYVLYVLWDPFTAGGTLTGRILDTTGNQVHVQTTTGTLTGPLTATPVTRATGLIFYSWNCYELSSVPANLVTGLRWMHDLHTQTIVDKGPFVY
jgi:hypothetical protein